MQPQSNQLQIEPALQAIASLPPRRLNSFISTGWIESLRRGQPVSAAGEPIPWFTYPAIDFLEGKVKADWSVLEWGCGNSSLWWASRVGTVVSIEHNPKWVEIIEPRLPPNARVLLRDNPSTYVNALQPDFSGPFDAIVIDGEERNACARAAVRLAKPTTLIVFDNADRIAVRDGIEFLGQCGWKRIDFFGLLPAYTHRICTSVFFRDDLLLTSAPPPCDLRSCLGPSAAQLLNE